MKTLLKFALVLGVISGSVGSSAAVVRPGGQQESVTYFYDNEEHSNIVGGTLLYCDGSHQHWGSYSIYTEYYYFGCS